MEGFRLLQVSITELLGIAVRISKSSDLLALSPHYLSYDVARYIDILGSSCEKMRFIFGRLCITKWYKKEKPPMRRLFGMGSGRSIVHQPANLGYMFGQPDNLLGVAEFIIVPGIQNDVLAVAASDGGGAVEHTTA